MKSILSEVSILSKLESYFEESLVPKNNLFTANDKVN
jgi:hypothetical protein